MKIYGRGIQIEMAACDILKIGHRWFNETVSHFSPEMGDDIYVMSYDLPLWFAIFYSFFFFY